jgi:hypothetical protein
MNRDTAATAHTWCLDQNRAAITVTLREDANSISDILIVQKNLLRLIHTYHAVPMPFRFAVRLCVSHLVYTVRPCLIHTCHTVPMPCRPAKRLDCLSHLIYTVPPCLIHTSHAVPLPCHNYVVLKATSQGHGTTRHGNGMLCLNQYRSS